MVPPIIAFAFRWVGGGFNVSSISCARTSYVDIKANRIHLDAPLVSGAGVRKVIQLFVVVLGAASLAACAQSSVVSKNSGLPGASRQASLEHNRKPSFVTNRRVAVTRKHTPVGVEQECSRDTGCIARSCQLLHRRNTDRERRKLRHARIDRRSSHVAIRYPVARDKCRYWAVRDSSGQ